MDKAKGRANEPAGALTGEKILRSRGRAARAKSSAKNTGEKEAVLVAGPHQPSGELMAEQHIEGANTGEKEAVIVAGHNHK